MANPLRSLGICVWEQIQEVGGCPHSHGRCLIPVEWPLSPSQHGELHAPPPSKSRNRSRKCVLQEQTLITETPAWGFNICTGLGRRQSEPGEESVNNLKRERSNLTSMMIFFFFLFLQWERKISLSSKRKDLGPRCYKNLLRNTQSRT